MAIGTFKTRKWAQTQNGMGLILKKAFGACEWWILICDLLIAPVLGCLKQCFAACDRVIVPVQNWIFSA